MGVVEDVGKGVTNLQKGDRVVVSFTIAGSIATSELGSGGVGRNGYVQGIRPIE